MAISESHIKKIIEQYLDGKPTFLVAVSIRRGNYISIIIDNNEGITIDQCAEISRVVEKSLDREKEDFELKVMSAGADSPFQNARQYIKNIGKQIKVKTKDKIKYQGKLLSFEAEKITLEIPPKTKKGQKPGKNRTSEICSFSLSEIEEAKSVITLNFIEE
jgi:ribosome maturation factor RimP